MQPLHGMHRKRIRQIAEAGSVPEIAWLTHVQEVQKFRELIDACLQFAPSLRPTVKKIHGDLVKLSGIQCLTPREANSDHTQDELRARWSACLHQVRESVAQRAPPRRVRRHSRSSDSLRPGSCRIQDTINSPVLVSDWARDRGVPGQRSSMHYPNHGRDSFVLRL